tara:strand:+ start:1131 stop:3464 length:2334 start_codon:yes stop_codon:yes gene_type:complete
MAGAQDRIYNIQDDDLDSFLDTIITADKSEREGYAPESGPLTDMGLRSALSFKGDTIEEKQIAFKKAYPEGELAMDTYSGKLTFRKNPNEPMAFVDKPFLQGIKDLDGKEFLTDVMELVSSAPHLAPEIGLAISPIGRGWGFLKNIGVYGGIGVAGEGLRQVGQEMSGTQKESFTKAYGDRPLKSGLYSAGGATAGKLLENIASGVRGYGGGGLFKVQEEGRNLQQAAKELGMPEPLPGQVLTTGFGSTLIKRLTAQSKMTYGNLNDYVRNMEDSLRGAIEGLVNKDSFNAIVNGITKSAKDAEDNLLKEFKNIPKDANFVTAGKNIQNAIVNYEKTSGNAVTLAYNVAKNIAKNKNVTLDFNNVVSVAKNLKKGVEADLKKIVNKQKTTNISPLDKELLNVVNDIIKINPNTITPEIAMALRQRLFDLKTPNAGEIAKRPEKLAGKLYDSITKSFDNPKAIGDENFTRAWKLANRKASTRFSNLEQVSIRNALKTDQPETIAKNMVNSYSASNNAQIRRLLGTNKTTRQKNWKKIQPHFISEIIGDGTDILTNLKKFDKFTLNSLIGSENVRVISRIANQMKNFKNLPVKTVEVDNLAVRPYMAKLLEGTDFRKIAGLQDLLKSNPKALDSFRAGLLDNIVQNSTVMKEGRILINYDSLQKTLKKLEASDVLKILKPEQLKSLKNAEYVTNMMKVMDDMGASLQAAATISGLRSGTKAAVKTLIENIGVGRLLSSKYGRRLLIGGAKKDMPQRETLKALTFFLSELDLKQIDEENK